MQNTKSIIEYEVNYGTKIIEQVRFVPPSVNPLEDIEPLDKNRKINKRTGKIIKCRKPKTKKDCKNTQISMQQDGRRMLFNAAPHLETGEIYFVTGCFEQNLATPKDYFEKSLSAYLKAIRDKCRRRDSSRNMSYALVKEHGVIKGYHMHMFIWHDDKNNPLFYESELESKWKYGEIKIEKIQSPEDLIKPMFYIFNVSLEGSENFSKEKVIRKREGLKYFLPEDHLVLFSSDITKIKKESTYINYSDESYCESSRKIGKDGSYFSQFLLKGGETSDQF